MINQSIKLGVTGLSRAGKTVFITALVHNLLHPHQLPFFNIISEGRFKDSYLEPVPDDDLPRFPYEKHLETLTCDKAHWPESTNTISQLRLTLEYEPESFIYRVLGGGKLHIDIIDYPGEWLLDLPLLDMSYEDWCQKSLELAEIPQRRVLAKDWLNAIKDIDPYSMQNDIVAEEISDLFKAYLSQCRANDYCFSNVPPGRFLMPGDLHGSPMMTFSPLLIEDTDKSKDQTLYQMMKNRFEAYKAKIIRPFFYNHFSRLDRQIVLVDALNAINSGPEAIKDMQRALQDILFCFKPGANSWLSSIWHKRIDHIIFAATKADQLHHKNHDRLTDIMSLLTKSAVERAEFSGAEVKAMALASVRSTREAYVTQNGETLPSIVGVPISGQKINGQIFNGEDELAIFPGDLPDRADIILEKNKELEALNKDLLFINFAPPPTQGETHKLHTDLPHIRLDRAIEFLIGDKFQ